MKVVMFRMGQKKTLPPINPHALPRVAPTSNWTMFTRTHSIDVVVNPHSRIPQHVHTPVIALSTPT